MTKLKIISMLWSAVYDLKLYISGSGKKTLDEIEAELDGIELYCRPYADTDDAQVGGRNPMNQPRARP